VGAQRIAHADCDRLLPNRKMHRALDLVGRINLRDNFLESACQVELPVKPFERLSVSARRPLRHANTPSIAAQQSPSAPSVNTMALLAKSSSTAPGNGAGTAGSMSVWLNRAGISSRNPAPRPTLAHGRARFAEPNCWILGPTAAPGRNFFAVSAAYWPRNTDTARKLSCVGGQRGDIMLRIPCVVSVRPRDQPPEAIPPYQCDGSREPDVRHLWTRSDIARRARSLTGKSRQARDNRRPGLAERPRR